MKQVLILIALVFGGICLISGCGEPDTPRKVRKKTLWDRAIPGNFSAQTIVRIDSASLDSFFAGYPDLEPYSDDVHKFYSGRDYACAWFDEQGMIEQAYSLTNRIRNIREDGITQELPYQRLFDSLMTESAASQNLSKERADLTEMMLTAQYFAFAHVVWEGMDEDASEAANWYLPRKKVSYKDYLDSMLAGDVQGPGQEPVYRQYERLKHFLKFFRALPEEAWAQLPEPARSVKPGDSGTLIREISRRLTWLGDYTGDTLGQVYHEGLVAGVKEFQRRHGLAEDGVIGKQVVRELNIPPSGRIRTILVNMERSRWVPVRVPTDHLIVNIPEFRLHVYQNDTLAWSCNVVVGKQVHKTVIFNDEVKYVVFSPYWNVPTSIVKNEIMPAMAKNSNYLERHNMEQTGTRGGLPVIRQKPGPRNSLGLVKFLFPNSYNIYLHDSPAKSLFNEADRAFSHGCIRVAEPERLAAFLLRNDSTWTEGKIRKAMQAGTEKYVTLKDRVPIFIAYFTAFVDSGGRINFRKDVYDRDAKMEEMVLAKGN